MDPAERAELILNVALQAFAERHVNSVSMRDIAEACGINVGLIYYYYENKDELLRRALAHAIAQLQAGYGVGRHLDAREELKAWLRMHVPIAPMLLRMVKIMADYAALHPGDAVIGGMIRDFYAREQGFLEDCLTRGMAAWGFREMDVKRVARMISLQLDGIFYASQARGDERIVADIESLCGMVAGL